MAAYAAVVVANWWDATLFTRLSFYVVVVTFGLAAVANAHRQDGGALRAARDAA